MVISINKNYSNPEKNLPNWLQEVSDKDLDTMVEIAEKASIPFENWVK